MITVSGLFYYPVKSLRGIALSEARLGTRGIVGDRRFMVTDEYGMFITQRDIPAMAHIQPALDGETLTLTAPNIEPIVVDTTTPGKRHEVVIWRDTCDAIDQGDEPAEWLSSVLGRSCRLVKMADDFVRQVDQTYAVRVTDQVGFADAYPILLSNESSLADLNSRMDVTLPMNRFRPNVVIVNAKPFEEDTWREIRIGNVDAVVVKPCKRCPITTTDQATGERGVEPLRTLGTFRRLPSGGVAFAQNVIHSAPGVISIGDEITFPSRQT